MKSSVVRACLFLYFGVVLSLPASAANEDGDGIIEAGENETGELARAAQNPVASMISLP